MRGPSPLSAYMFHNQTIENDEPRKTQSVFQVGDERGVSRNDLKGDLDDDELYQTQSGSKKKNHSAFTEPANIKNDNVDQSEETNKQKSHKPLNYFIGDIMSQFDVEIEQRDLLSSSKESETQLEKTLLEE